MYRDGIIYIKIEIIPVIIEGRLFTINFDILLLPNDKILKFTIINLLLTVIGINPILIQIIPSLYIIGSPKIITNR